MDNVDVLVAVAVAVASSVTRAGAAIASLIGPPNSVPIAISTDTTACTTRAQRRRGATTNPSVNMPASVCDFTNRYPVWARHAATIMDVPVDGIGGSARRG